MLNQQTLRKKLASTHNIKHITEAIELVASIKLQKLLQKIEHFRLYAAKMAEIVKNLTQAAEGQSHPFFEVRDIKNIGVIIVTSDKGLCGSYNSNLLRQADHFLDQHCNTPLKLTLFGQKSVDHYSKQRYEIQNKYVNYHSKINETHVKTWCEEFIKSFESKMLDEVWIIYTHYKNILVRETKVEKILPMQREESKATKKSHATEEHQKNIKSDYIFEPNVEVIYNRIIPYTLYTKILSLLLESQASELSARVVSMKAATTNAEEMISKLTLIKNKIRQLGITQEILEINAGAEGIS
jgi:F-type H+-transporting ATPase subunit gamma